MGIMSGVIGRISIFLVMSILVFSPVWAATVILKIEPTSVKSKTSNQQLNLTVNLTEPYNITQFNITIPSGFVFISGSNSTTASDSVFSNTSDTLVWENTTVLGFVDEDIDQHFLFNVSAPSSLGNHNFTVSNLDTDEGVDLDDVNVTVIYNLPIWGVLHSIHSTISDGTETPNQRVDDLKINYHWGSPIDHDYLMDAGEWDEIRNEANTNDTDNNFTYFPGYEWRGDNFNGAEITIFFVDGGPSSFAQGSNAAYDTLSEILDWLQENNGMGCAAHPARNGNLWDWSDTTTDNETLLPCIEMINKDDWYWDEFWNCSDDSICTNYSNPKPYSGVTWTNGVRAALDQGRHLGFVGGWDYHGAYPGTPTAYTGLAKVDNWTREGVFDAIYNRHVWAADQKILMNVTFDNGSGIFYMGDIFNVTPSNIWINYTVNASIGNTVSNTSIFIDGVVFNVTNCSSANYQGAFNVSFSDNDEHYIFIEAVQEDDTRAWSSPMFISLSPDDLPPGITIHSPTNMTYNDSTITLGVTANETIHTWWYQLNTNGTNMTFSPNTTITAVLGMNNITVWANDSSGNEGLSTEFFTYECVESWSCSSWSTCSGGTQTRTCTDSSSCGTTVSKPSESQSCSVYVPPPTPPPPDEEENETIDDTEPEVDITLISAEIPLVNQSHNVVTPVNETVDATWENITEEEPVAMVINSTEMAVSEITFRVRNRKTVQSQLTIKTLGQEVPEVVQQVMEKKMYRYLEINKKNITDEEIDGNITIKFHVEKSWLDENNLSGDDIVLWRHATNWTQLATTKTNENSNFVFYEALSPGFSFFAIGEGVTDSEPGGIPFVFPWWILIPVVVVIVIISFIIYRKKKKPPWYSGDYYEIQKTLGGLG